MCVIRNIFFDSRACYAYELVFVFRLLAARNHVFTELIGFKPEAKGIGV